MASIQIDIVSAEGQIHHGEAAMVFAPAEEGEVGIAPKHSPLLTRLSPGEVVVQTESKEKLHFFVGGGILEVQPNQVTVLADTALRAKDADEAAAQEARRSAEEKLARANGDIDMARAQAELAQAAALVKFVKDLKRRHRG
ncbi:MAG: F0F1 ATP synthase subunit epsilon [Sinobacteraceae bacterium]|nr:F0F1 ATP synthase subunit epsilon [Nevskiaceae bacterium]